MVYGEVSFHLQEHLSNDLALLLLPDLALGFAGPRAASATRPRRAGCACAPVKHTRNVS